MPSCAVLVVSSDSYSDLWQPFFRLFREHWPDCPFRVYLGTQTANDEIPDVQVLQAGNRDLPWSDCMRSFLNAVDATYVLVLLEDFFLTGRVSNADVSDQIAALSELGGTVLRLQPDPPPTIRLAGRLAKIGEQHRLAPFRVSLQASIWNREALLRLLKDGESPWEFEKRGTLRSQAEPHGFYCTWKQAFPYRQVVEQGEWFWSAARRYRRLNIGCDFRARRVMNPVKALRKQAMVQARRGLGRLLMAPMRSRELDPYAPIASGRSIRVAFLTNVIPPYHKPVLHALASRYAAFRVLLSTPMEANRPWSVDWGDLDVVLQRTFTKKGTWRHQRGFSEDLAVHVPIDTLSRLKAFAPDVIISAEMGARTLLAAIYRQLNPHCRLVVWSEVAVSTESGRGRARYGLRKLLVSRADAFLAVGASAATYLEQIGADPRKIFKIAYTTDLERFAAVPLTRPAGQERRLLFCGQFVERKGLIPFLETLSRWAADHPARTVTFGLAGDGPLKQKIAEFPLASNVKLEFLGVFEYGDLLQVYASGGVFVLPTLADTWAVVVNEALAAGLPVLGSRYAQAVNELIEQERNGWLFTPDDVDDTYQAIDRVMNTSDEVLDGMRAYGRQVARQWTPGRVAELIGRAVEDCVGR